MKNEFSLQNLNVKHTLTKIFIENSCASLPNEINHDKYGIHLEPCYKQFTLILAKSKEKLPKNSTTIWKILISSRKRDIGLPKRIWVMFGVSCIRI